MDNEKFLSHYGIPGMRWGVRRGLHTGAKPKLSTRSGYKAIKEDAHTIKKLHQAKIETILYSDAGGSKKQKQARIDEPLMKKTWNEFINTMETKKGKAYVDAVFAEVNKNRN